MKKFFYFCSAVLVCLLSVFCFSSCSKNELSKVSKNLSSYSITAELDEQNMSLDAEQNLLYYNSTGRDLDYLCFHLYPRAFREGAGVLPYTVLNSATCFPNGLSYGDIEILQVKVKGSDAKFELVGEDEDILKVEFGFALKNKKTVDIYIKFKVKIPNCTHRFGYYGYNINLGNWYPLVCKYSGSDFDMTPYYATGDPFFSDIANYTVKFTYNKKYVFCSTGDVVTEIVGDRAVSTSGARAVRDFAACLSADAGVATSSVGDTKITYMGYSEDRDLNKYCTLSAEAVEFFNKTFGQYPYSSLYVVRTPFIYGGMEYPNIVFISDSIDEEEEYSKVVVHEIAHQWWYSVVGNNEITEAWLDESLAEYSTALFFEHNGKYNISYRDFVKNALSSYLLYVDVINTLTGEVNTKMNLRVNEYKNDYEYSYMVYVKGVIMFDSLRNMVGEKKLLAGLKKYYKSNKFKVASKADFLSAFKSACHSDLDGFFDGYLNGTTIISKIN